MSVLTWLLDTIFPPQKHALLVRSTTLDELLSHLDPIMIQGGVALFPYKNRLVRALITEAKYKNNPEAQKLLGQALGDFLYEWLGEINGLDNRPVALVPIPLARKRYRERGYNQVTEIARHALRGDSISLMPHLLTRVRDTAPQTRLDKEARQKNLDGAFRAALLNPLYLYIVMDDVATTGATLRNAIQALREAGAEHIVPLAIAY